MIALLAKLVEVTPTTPTLRIVDAERGQAAANASSNSAPGARPEAGRFHLFAKIMQRVGLTARSGGVLHQFQ